MQKLWEQRKNGALKSFEMKKAPRTFQKMQFFLEFWNVWNADF